MVERVAKTGTERGIARTTEHAESIAIGATEYDRMNVPRWSGLACAGSLALLAIGERAPDPARPAVYGHHPALDPDGAVHFGLGGFTGGGVTFPAAR
jgi:hypothetical protein